MTIELHTWNTPNGRKISVALEEMGVPYKVIPVNIGKGEQMAPAFLKLSPNNKIPAIVDPDGPNGKPVSIFESGAILLYLGEKTGKFLATDLRGRMETIEWLFWQMGGLGPMAGQNHHFRLYAKEKIPYAIERYVNETNRLYGVMDRRLADRRFLAGEAYTIADMASYPWVQPERQGQNIDEFPNLKRWKAEIAARPATIRAYEKGKAVNITPVVTDDAAKILFGQKAIKTHTG